MNAESLLVEAIKACIYEARLRESELTLSTGKKAKFGSVEHVKDLEARIRDMSVWRDRSRRGSDTRATYARTVQKLRAELKSAQNASRRAEEQVKGNPKVKKVKPTVKVSGASVQHED